MVSATTEAVCLRQYIIKVVFYVFYKHDVLFLIFNMNPCYVLAGTAVNVCEIC